jgi:hypothetical protein
LTKGTKSSVDDETFAVPAKVYPASVQLLSLKSYRKDILTGFVISAGGLGESLVMIPFLHNNFSIRLIFRLALRLWH